MHTYRIARSMRMCQRYWYCSRRHRLFAKCLSQDYIVYAQCINLCPFQYEAFCVVYKIIRSEILSLYNTRNRHNHITGEVYELNSLVSNLQHKKTNINHVHNDLWYILKANGKPDIRYELCKHHYYHGSWRPTMVSATVLTSEEVMFASGLNAIKWKALIPSTKPMNKCEICMIT